MPTSPFRNAPTRRTLLSGRKSTRFSSSTSLERARSETLIVRRGAEFPFLAWPLLTTGTQGSHSHSSDAQEGSRHQARLPLHRRSAGPSARRRRPPLVPFFEPLRLHVGRSVAVSECCRTPPNCSFSQAIRRRPSQLDPPSDSTTSRHACTGESSRRRHLRSGSRSTRPCSRPP